jgi:uncharacterized protein (TIGR03083 family)
MTTSKPDIRDIDVRVDAAAYRAVRRNVADLLADRPDVVPRIVPASPEWTVRDVAAHFVEIARGVVLRLTGQPVDWPFQTGSAAIPELLAEWDRVGAVLDPLVDGSTVIQDRAMVMDAFTHEWDLRRVLGVPVPAGHPAYPNALDLLVTGFAASVRQRGLPALRIETDGRHWTIGEGEPVATLSGPRNDVYRSLAGRRTHEQIAALGWTAEPTPWLPAFEWGPFHPPVRPTE